MQSADLFFGEDDNNSNFYFDNSNVQKPYRIINFHNSAKLIQSSGINLSESISIWNYSSRTQHEFLYYISDMINTMSEADRYSELKKKKKFYNKIEIEVNKAR